MNDRSDSLSEEEDKKPQVKPYDQVLESIKGYKKNRMDREGELQNMQHMKNALVQTGYASAREFIAEQVDWFDSRWKES